MKNLAQNACLVAGSLTHCQFMGCLVHCCLSDSLLPPWNLADSLGHCWLPGSLPAHGSLAHCQLMGRLAHCQLTGAWLIASSGGAWLIAGSLTHYCLLGTLLTSCSLLALWAPCRFPGSLLAPWLIAGSWNACFICWI